MSRSGGFTLVEVLVVLGVLVVSVFLSAEVLNQMDRSIRYPEAQVNLGAISTVIRETLKYQKTCQTAVVGVNGMSDSSIMAGTQTMPMRLPGILADGTPADDWLQVGSRVQNLVITQMRLANSLSLGSGKYFSEVELGAQVAGTGMQLKPILAGGLYYTLSGGSIASCDNESVDPVPLCEEMGCDWDANRTPACQCTPIDLTCPPQQFLTGVDADGKQICSPLGGSQCPPGTYLRGVTLGAPVCDPLPAPAAPVVVTCSGVQPARTACCADGTWSPPHPPVSGAEQYSFCGCGNSPVWWMTMDSFGNPIPTGC